ncbi:glycosyltransferase [Marinobacter pelagius]|uniref:glycosyltransferase n=1 Tax=Marinobacter sp. C7 TaxID=2951363 RepID=UPI001EF0057C|nr:glycosyltransferase [Marinobacter sp. C7]MCG7199121.1 glycosyltransferase [Marinobacter sp. C7]
MIMNLYREIDRSQYQFDFAYFTNDRCDFDDEIEALDGRIIRLKGDNPIQRFWSLFKALRLGDWSIVQSHMLFSTGLNLFAARLAGVPIRIAHSHSTSDLNSSSMVGRIYQGAMRWLMSWVPTRYVACGTAAAEYLFPGQPDVEIIPNAVNIDRFDQADGSDVERELAIPEGCISVLQVGRLMPVKNQAWSLRIAASLRESGADFQLLFVGAGPDKATLEAEIVELGLDENVKLLGLREDIAELMAAADVMLMPSLHEGFPVVLVESQAGGVPAVISDAISREVDLGLGLVDFVGLDESAELWAAHITEAARKKEVEGTIRKETLEKYGFSSRAGAKRLAELYQTA